MMPGASLYLVGNRVCELRATDMGNEADCRFMVVGRLNEMRHRIERSTGESVESFDGGQVVVPACTVGKTDMRVGSYVNRSIK